MKIGIITIHNAYNYGAVFQAFALKEYIKSVISENDVVNVIDYRTPFFEDKKKIHFSKDIVSNVIELERLAMTPKRKRRDNAFESFICENDSLSEKCLNRTEISKIAADYDILIAGSDQVWNFHITDGDLTYFLDIDGFNGKKFSYASSMGAFRFYQNDEEKIKRIFDTFSAFSCRESDGCEYLSKLTGKNFVQVCDPTLLLNSERYAKLFDGKVRNKIKKLAEREYLLIYNLSSSNEVFSVAKRVAEERNLKIYQIFPSLRKKSTVDVLLNDISPEEFLYLYSKTQFVVTNSFHGTCFSLIFNKDFYTVKPTGSNNRLVTLLSEAGITERLIVDNEGIKQLVCEDKIDYVHVMNNFNEYFLFSKGFISDNLFNK